MANALTRSSHPKSRFGAYANVSWEEYKTNIPRGRGSFRPMNLFREYLILWMYDGHAIRKVDQESENVYLFPKNWMREQCCIALVFFTEIC